MSESAWVVLEEISGDALAEILRGWLEANDIPVVISQESIGQASYHLLVGALGRIQLLVPASKEEAARQLLQQYWDQSSSEEADEGYS